MMRYLRGDSQHTPALMAWLGLQGDEQQLLGNMGSRDSPVSKDRERRRHGKRAWGSGQVPGMGGGGAQVEMGTRAQPGAATRAPRASERTNLDPSNCLEAGDAGAGPLWGGEGMERTQADFL